VRIPPIVDVDLEDPIILPYCGLKNMRPSLKIIVYTLFQNLGLGNFIMVRHANLELYPMGMGRAKNAIVKDEHYENLHVQWWVSMKKGARNNRELYWDCWVSKWKCNLVYPKLWVDISSILYSFPTRSNVTINSIMMISVNHVTKAKQNLYVINEIIQV
jgi:hypothetical protein